MPKIARKQSKGSSSEMVDREAMEKLRDYECDLLPGTKHMWLIPMERGYWVIRHLRQTMFNQLVEKCREQYSQVAVLVKDKNKREKLKRQIADSIVGQIHCMNGQFVEWKNGEWNQVADGSRLRKKTMQALREGAAKRKEAVSMELMQATAQSMAFAILQQQQLQHQQQFRPSFPNSSPPPFPVNVSRPSTVAGLDCFTSDADTSVSNSTAFRTRGRPEPAFLMAEPVNTTTDTNVATSARGANLGAANDDGSNASSADWDLSSPRSL